MSVQIWSGSGVDFETDTSGQRKTDSYRMSAEMFNEYAGAAPSSARCEVEARRLEHGQEAQMNSGQDAATLAVTSSTKTLALAISGRTTRG